MALEGARALADPAASAAVQRPAAPRRMGVTEALARHGLLIGCLAIFMGVVGVRLPEEFGQDGWLALVAGRTVAHTGLPHHDVLTTWTFGKEWVDQQWLAHLGAYGLYALGGITLLALCHVLLLGGAVAAASAFARRAGVTARTCAWLLVLTIYPILLAGGAVRTQSFVLPLFVAVLALLAGDTRRPSRRVLLALPLLVLWANLHGSAVLGACLVAMRGVLGLIERRTWPRYIALFAGAGASIIATPYGTGAFGYYRHTLVNPAFRTLVTEWGAPTPSLVNAPIFLLIGCAIWLLARRVGELGLFALIAELVLVLMALTAVRNAVWLGLGSIVLLAPALDHELGKRELSVARMNRMVAIVGLYFVALIVVIVGWRGDAAITTAFPAAADRAIMKTLDARPDARVYSNERYADWLLFEHPDLDGRVAFDARFELLSPSQLQRIFAWTNQIGDHWRSAVVGSDVIVLDMADEQALATSLEHDARYHRAYADADIAVFVSRRPA